MRKLFPAIVVLVVCGFASAQQKATPKSSSPASSNSGKATSNKTATSDTERIADIRHLLAVTGSRDMVNQMKVTLMDQFRQSSPNLPPDMFREMLAEMKAEDLEEAIIPIYLKHFTADDIKHLIAFYESPFGKKVTRVMPQILQESNEAGMNWGQSVVTKVATKWRKEGKLTEREYEQLVGPEDAPR
jgi:hypothetical protein